MRRFPRERGRRGFTLVEITVAIGIFGIIMLGLAAVAGISARGGYSSRQRLRATYLVGHMLETLSSPSIVADADLSAFGDDDTRNHSTYPSGGVTENWAQTISMQMGSDAWGTIGVESGAPIPGKYRITVTVSWLFRGRTSSVTMMAVR